jgi:hypothetical protein
MLTGTSWILNLLKMDTQICGFASYGAILTLLEAGLSGIPSCYMPMCPLNASFIEKLDYHRRKFIWVGVKKKKIIHMVKL